MRRVLTGLLYIVVIAVVAAVWIVRSNSTFGETFYTLESRKIEEPVRLILLTDLHQKSFGSGNEELIGRVEALKPDAILIAGDMVNKKKTDWDCAVELCGKLADIAPVYYGLGNHENTALYGSDLNKDFLEASADVLGESQEDFAPLVRDKEAWDALEKTGVHLVQNSSETVELNGNSVEIGGVSTNLSSFWPYSGQFITRFSDSSPDRFKILICHCPDVAARYLSDAAIDLAVSGHNHGGLIRIPGKGGLISASLELFPEYDAGLFELDSMSLLVSRGLGGHGLVPRVFNQPELVVLDIS